MFEEFVILNRSRWMLLAAVAYTLWSLISVLWRGWSVGEMFFWMWWEIVLSGISTTLLMHRWYKKVGGGLSHQAFRAALGVAFATFLGLALATGFTLVTLAADKVLVRDLGGYIQARLSTLLVLAALMTALHLMISRGSGFQTMTRVQVEGPLITRLMSILGVYAVLIFFYHWSGLTKLEFNQTNQMVMGSALLGTKLVLELWQWWKSFGNNLTIVSREEVT